MKKINNGVRPGVLLIVITMVVILGIALKYGFHKPSSQPIVESVGVKNTQAVEIAVVEALVSKTPAVSHQETNVAVTSLADGSVIIRDSGGTVAMMPVSSTNPTFLSESQVRAMQRKQ